MSIMDTRHEAEERYDQLCARGQQPSVTRQQFADWWIVLEASWALSSHIDLRHWKSDPEIKMAIDRARAATRYANELVRQAVWEEG